MRHGLSRLVTRCYRILSFALIAIQDHASNPGVGFVAELQRLTIGAASELVIVAKRWACLTLKQHRVHAIQAAT